MIYLDDRIDLYPQELIDRWTAALPQWRKEQVLAMRHEAGRRQRLMAYRLLCRALRQEFGILEPPTFQYNEHGKPFLTGVHFSLSHCKGAVACVVSTKPCGIDIEHIDRNISDSLIRYTMNEAEIAQISQAQDREVEFFRLWTTKEAVLKLEGTGIRDNMKDVLPHCPYTIQTRVTPRHILTTALQ